MTILVTGGAGFIGSHIVEHFQNADDVIVLDSLRSGFKSNIDPFKVRFIHGSVTDATVVGDIMKGVDYVFHLAALVSVPESMEKPREAVEINVQGTLHILEAARACKVKKVVISSSAAIYGDNPTVPKIETMLPEPRSPYAITKLDDEYYARRGTYRPGCRPSRWIVRFKKPALWGPPTSVCRSHACGILTSSDRARTPNPNTLLQCRCSSTNAFAVKPWLSTGMANRRATSFT